MNQRRSQRITATAEEDEEDEKDDEFHPMLPSRYGKLVHDLHHARCESLQALANQRQEEVLRLRDDPASQAPGRDMERAKGE